MNLQERVTTYRLPIKQQRVIEAILDDLELNSFLTGSEICKKFKVSFSSLTRMSKTLNYSGFPELKRDIEKLYKSEYSPTSQIENFILDAKNKSIFDIVYQAEINALKRLKNSINENDLLQAAKKINKAKRVFIIGVGQLAPIVQKLENSLMLLSKETIIFTDIGFSKLSEIHSITSSDIVIVFSMNKELIEIKDFLAKRNANKVSSILFTDKKVGRLQKDASISFTASSSGNGMINCITPFLVITNILESVLFSLDKHVHLSKIRKIERRWNSLPLFLN